MSALKRSDHYLPGSETNLAQQSSIDHRTELLSKEVKLLLEAGIDSNKLLENGDTLVFIAAQEGKVEEVRLLLRAGADSNKPTNNGITPLLIASERGHADIVRLLLAFGADTSMTGDSGATLFAYCS